MQQEQQQEGAVHLGTCSNMESVRVAKQKKKKDSHKSTNMFATGGDVRCKATGVRGISATGLRSRMLRTDGLSFGDKVSIPS